MDPGRVAHAHTTLRRSNDAALAAAQMAPNRRTSAAAACIRGESRCALSCLRPAHSPRRPTLRCAVHACCLLHTRLQQSSTLALHRPKAHTPCASPLCTRIRRHRLDEIRSLGPHFLRSRASLASVSVTEAAGPWRVGSDYLRKAPRVRFFAAGEAAMAQVACWAAR